MTKNSTNCATLPSLLVAEPFPPFTVASFQVTTNFTFWTLKAGIMIMTLVLEDLALQPSKQRQPLDLALELRLQTPDLASALLLQMLVLILVPQPRNQQLGVDLVLEESADLASAVLAKPFKIVIAGSTSRIKENLTTFSIKYRIYWARDLAKAMSSISTTEHLSKAIPKITASWCLHCKLAKSGLKWHTQSNSSFLVTEYVKFVHEQ